MRQAIVCVLPRRHHEMTDVGIIVPNKTVLRVSHHLTDVTLIKHVPVPLMDEWQGRYEVSPSLCPPVLGWIFGSSDLRIHCAPAGQKASP